MSKLIDINALNKNNDYINNNVNARLTDNASKNLLKLLWSPNTSFYVGELLITVNEDYSLTLNGTATYQWLNLDFSSGISTAINVPPHKPVIASISESFVKTNIGCGYFKSDGTVYDHIVQTSIHSEPFTYPADAVKMRTYLWFYIGQTFDNVTIYPMIRYADITDSTYEPYYRTNKQLDTDLSTAESNITDVKDYIGYTDDDIYGLEVDYENELSTRLAAAVGKTSGNDFDNTNAWGGRRRCNLTDNGIVTAYYGDTAYTETGALTQAVTVGSVEYPIGTSVQVMVEQPKFYYKVIPLKLESYTTQNGDIGYHIRKARYYISDTPKNGFKLHPAFIRNGAEKEKIYLSAYEGSLYDVSESSYITDDAQVADFNVDKMSSIANVKPISGSSQNLTRANARKLANNRGIGWEQLYVHTASATQLLFMIEYATLNSQQAIGDGVVSKANGSGNESENTGGTSSLGNVSGNVSNNEISYRGEENFWGNIYKFEDGINIQNPTPFNDGTYGNVYIADNNFTDDTNLLPYEDTNIYPCKASSAFITAFGYDKKFDWLFIPTEAKGGLYQLLCDMYWNSQTGWTFSSLGGRWNVGNQAGAFEYGMNFYDTLARSRAISSRLVYIPDANESNRSLKQIDKDLNEVENGYIPNAGNSKDGMGLNISRESAISLTSTSNMITISSDDNVNINANFNLNLNASDDINANADANIIVTADENIEIKAGGLLSIGNGNITYDDTTYVVNHYTDINHKCNSNEYDITDFNTIMLESYQPLEGVQDGKANISIDTDGWVYVKSNTYSNTVYKSDINNNDFESVISRVIFNEGRICYDYKGYAIRFDNDIYTSLIVEQGRVFKGTSSYFMATPKKYVLSDNIIGNIPQILNQLYIVCEDSITRNEFEIQIAQNRTFSTPYIIPDTKVKVIADSSLNVDAGFETSTDEAILFETHTGSDLTLENLYFGSTNSGINTYLFNVTNSDCKITLRNCRIHNITDIFKTSIIPKILIIENCTFELSNQWTINSTSSDCRTLIFNNNVITNGSIDFQLSTTSNVGYDGIISNNAGNLTFSGTGTGKLKLWNNSSTFTTK